MAQRKGRWTEAHVKRLYWRAGFGATDKEAKYWVKQGRAATINWFLNGGHGPYGSSALHGPAPKDNGQPIDRNNDYRHDVIWWLDRMVRSQRPLTEKMTLFWHDHFATRDQNQPLMIKQNEMLRKNALGSFQTLLQAVTKDPAMQLFLSIANSDKAQPNENYAREVMELFTLGGKGYTEKDIREAARALTGFKTRFTTDLTAPGDRIDYSAANHDSGRKTIFGKSGNFDWKDVTELVIKHKNHAPFLITKLWDFFITTKIDPATRTRLVKLYKSNKFKLKPVLKEIISHPAMYKNLDKPDMVKAPVVYVAGNLRLTGRSIDTSDWNYLTDSMGQRLFRPPSVAGWEWGPAWLTTNSIRWRFTSASTVLRGGPAEVKDGSTPTNLSPAKMLARARKAAGNPWTSRKTDTVLASLAKQLHDTINSDASQKQLYADMSQRVLRHLLMSGPDAQVH